MTSHTRLTYPQKLRALANKYYQRAEWHPRAGDYYTTSRDDLELYQIKDVVERDGELIVITRYAHLPEDEGSLAEWRMNDFLSPQSFGYARVWVPRWVLETLPHQQDPAAPPPAPGQFYQHQNGNLYLVVYLGTLEDTEEECVVYLCQKSGRAWVRKLSDWCAFKNGSPRFSPVPDEVTDTVSRLVGDGN